jgi:enediyne biosynthesis protein E4
MLFGRVAKVFIISAIACAVIPFQRFAVSHAAPQANLSAQNKPPAGIPRAAPPIFTDIAAQVGLTVPHISSPDKKYILESMSGGVGIFDCDGDGLQDIVVVRGSTIDRYRHGGDPMVTLYHQEPGGKFTDITESAGLTRRGWGMGVAVADFDNDGKLDLFVTGYGGNALYRNLGNCKFEDVAEKAGVRGGGFSTGAAWGDYDRDGNVDLFVSRYVHMDIDHLPEFGKGQHCLFKGIPVQCGPWGMEGESDLLYHNRGDGTFEEVSEKAGVHDSAGHYGLGVTWADYDNDGWPDLFVANDSGPNYLYHNNHNGTFTETAVLAGVAYSGDGGLLGNMGVDFGDYDHRGLLDIFVTTFADQPDALFRTLGSQGFSDASLISKLAQSSYPLVKWGTGFFDMENDGWLDLFVACGHVYPQMDHAQGSAPYRESMLLYRNNRDGTFEDVSARAGLAKIPPASRRGAAFGDVFDTGNVDIVVLNVGEPPTFLLNTAKNTNHRVLFQLEGTRSNRAAIGARIMVKTGGVSQLSEVRGGASYLSQNDLRLHFGLGGESKMDTVEIRWPGGNVERVKNLAADFIYRIVEGKGVQSAKPLPPPDSVVTLSAKPQ